MSPVRVGVLYPGHAAEDDYAVLAHALAPAVQVELAHTVVARDEHRPAPLREVGSDDRLRDGAEQLRGRGVDAVTWACTSGSFVFGHDGALHQVAVLEQELGVPASSTSFAFVEALRHLGATRVSVSATYPRQLTDRFVGFLAEAGVEVLDVRAAGVVTAAQVGTFERDHVLELAVDTTHPEAEALLLPDTALPTARWLADLRASADVPVLTANQVTLWDVLRVADHPVGRSTPTSPWT